MKYLSTKQWAEKVGVSERSARYYCAEGRIEGAFLTGKSWNIPVDSPVPVRKIKQVVFPLLKILKEEKASKIKGGIYHRIQVDLTYNSNHIEGSRLSHEQTRYIFETNTIGLEGTAVNIDDIIETSNHFRAIDYVIENAGTKLSETFIKQLHNILKSGTSDARLDWFNVGAYKRLPNEVGGMETTLPELVEKEIKALLKEYNSIKEPTFDQILDFHQRFESIHPFQDGNGRVGRLIMFSECLRLGYVPFIITDELKMFYYNGLQNWPRIKGYLRDTCLSAQDDFKKILDKFRIKY